MRLTLSPKTRRATGIALRSNDFDEKTLLGIAAEVGNLESMRVMMEMGADPRADNGTALHQAAFFGQTAAVELLLDAGVPVNVTAGRGRPDTPLTWTILYSHYETAILLLRRGAAFEGPLSLVREGNNHREPGYERVDALLADVEAAGSWAAYAREPRRDAHRQALCSH